MIDKDDRLWIDHITTTNQSQVPCAPINVFVGPNNGGKSRLLRELVESITGETRSRAIVGGVSVHRPRTVHARRRCRPRAERSNGQLSVTGLDKTLQHYTGLNIGRTFAEVRDFARTSRKPIEFLRRLGPLLVTYLPTDTRLAGVNAQNAPQKTGLLAELLNERERARAALTEIRDAFQVHAYLDYATSLGSLCIRVSRNNVEIPDHPSDAKPMLERLESIHEQGDGIRSYATIVATLHALSRPLLIVDEPEAFLPPPLAFRIGKVIAEQARCRGQAFVATHSPDVVRGLLSTDVDAHVTRVTRSESGNRLAVADTELIKKLATDPLLSSGRVLEGLFYRGVIVTEGDSDARLYEALSRRYDSGADLHCVNAIGKDAVPQIRDLYRQAGVPNVAALDIDVLNDEDALGRHLAAAGCAPGQLSELLQLQSTIASSVTSDPATSITELHEHVRSLDSFLSSDDGEVAPAQRLARARRLLGKASATTRAWRDMKRCGRDSLSESVAADLDTLLSRLDRLGIIINPHGELESLLADQGISYTTDKPKWIRSALRLLPELGINRGKRCWKMTARIHNACETP